MAMLLGWAQTVRAVEQPEPMPQVVLADSVPEPVGPPTDNLYQFALYKLKNMNWGSFATSFVVCWGARAGLEHLLKQKVHNLRPDGSDYHSFPSRHSSWAYGLASEAAFYFGEYSPWWGVGSQAVANGVGFQRVIKRRHYPGDIMAGAAIGISTELVSEVIGNWIFGYDKTYPNVWTCPNLNAPTLVVTTGTSFPLQEMYGAYRLGTALESTVRGIVPVGEHFGATVAFDMQSAPVKSTVGERYVEPLTSLTLLAGASWHSAIADGPFGFTAYGEAGYRRNLNLKGLEVGRNAPMMRVGMINTLMLTKRFSIGWEAGYSLTSMSIAGQSRALSSIGVSFLTRAAF